MNKQLKLIISTITLSTCLLICGNNVQAIEGRNLQTAIHKDLSSGDSINDQELVKQQINEYFKIYFKSLETLTKPNYDEVVEKNSNTAIYAGASELQVEQYKLINLSYQNVKFEVNFDELNIDNSKAHASIKMKSEFNYNNAPDVKSGMYNIKYSFDLEKDLSGKWIIITIDSNYDQFDAFKEAAQKNKSRSKRDLTSTNNLDNVKDELLNQAKETVKNLGGSLNVDKTPKETGKRVKRSLNSYPYEAYKGQFYAQVHAPQNQNNKWFKYVDGNDCTNFVSQCIWYSYGGINEGIASKSRMVNGGVDDGWFASAWGVSTPWSSVEGLWNRIVNRYPGNGPNGTGYNNNKPYHEFAPGRIYVGEVLQFKNISKHSDYRHSVYVTSSKNGSNKYYNEIFVSQHSSDLYNRNLYDLIMNYGGNSCYMRDIALTSANLNGGPGSN